MATEQTTGPDSNTPGAAAAASVTPDPVLAELLRRHAAGEKLTPEENGKVGGWAPKLKRIFGGKSGSDSQPAESGAEARDAAVVDSVSQSQAPSARLPAPEIRPGLIDRCTRNILKATDSTVCDLVEHHAKRAGADDEKAASIAAKVAMPAVSKELLVDLSPDMLDAFGISPRVYLGLCALAGLGTWGTNIFLAVDELKELRAKNGPAITPAASQSGGSQPENVKGIPLPTPPAPKGAPPTLT